MQVRTVTHAAPTSTASPARTQQRDAGGDVVLGQQHAAGGEQERRARPA